MFLARRINRVLYELKKKRKWRDCISWFGTITSQDLLVHSSSAVGATFRVNRNKKEFLKWKTIFSLSKFYTSCRMLHIVWCQITPHRMSHLYAWLSLPVRTKHPPADIYINTFEMDRFFSSCREIVWWINEKSENKSIFKYLKKFSFPYLRLTDPSVWTSVVA